jgi:hypothetical protein
MVTCSVHQLGEQRHVMLLSRVSKNESADAHHYLIKSVRVDLRFDDLCGETVVEVNGNFRLVLEHRLFKHEGVFAQGAHNMGGFLRDGHGVHQSRRGAVLFANVACRLYTTLPDKVARSPVNQPMRSLSRLRTTSAWHLD